MCYVMWPRKLLLVSVFGQGKFFLRDTGFRDEHGLSLTAVVQLTGRSVLAWGPGYWNEAFRNIFFWGGDSVQKRADPFVNTWRMN